MIQTVNLFDFRNAFKHSDRADQFSFEALELIFNYYEALEDDTGNQIEFDMIAICCEWAEEDAETLAQYYDFEINDMSGSKLLMHVHEEMQKATHVAGVTSENKIVYMTF